MGEREAANILAQRWAEEDRKKKLGIEPEDEARVERSKRRRQERSEDKRPRDRPEESAEQERSRALDVSRSGRSRTEQQDKQDDTTVEDDARRAERQRLQFQLGQAGTPRPERSEEQSSGWHTVEVVRREQEPKSESLGLDHVSRASQKRPDSSKNNSKNKLKGVFGLSDSDDERTKQLTTSKKRRVAPVIDLPPLPSAPAPQTCVATAPVIFTASCVAAVQMKVAQWKKGMNGKAAKMPEELRREVAAVMMGTQ